MPKRVSPAQHREQKARYRQRTGAYVATNAGRYWTADEDRAIVEHAITDRELAFRLGRSVGAIQCRRHRLKT